MAHRTSRFPKPSLEWPWWLCPILAVGVYLGLDHGPPWIKLLAPWAGPIAWLCALPAVPVGFRSWRRRRLLTRYTGLAAIRDMDWRDFEKLCGAAYRRQGFRVAETGRAGPDGGVDLVVRKNGAVWLVQCKRWRNVRVGVREVRELYGIVAGEGAARGVLITCGGFTDEARAFALGKALDLLDGNGLLELLRPVQREVPSCPECGAPMVLRTAKRGEQAGTRFWGCSTFPTCRAILNNRGRS